jgi:hypothetical protein
MFNFDVAVDKNNNPKPFVPINLKLWTGTGTPSGGSPRPTK